MFFRIFHHILTSINRHGLLVEVIGTYVFQQAFSLLRVSLDIYVHTTGIVFIGVMHHNNDYCFVRWQFVTSVSKGAASVFVTNKNFKLINVMNATHTLLGERVFPFDPI
jgi:hypothetical protein